MSAEPETVLASRQLLYTFTRSRFVRGKAAVELSRYARRVSNGPRACKGGRRSGRGCCPPPAFFRVYLPQYKTMPVNNGTARCRTLARHTTSKGENAK